MSRPPRVQILARDNGAGLSRDIALLAAALTAAGADVQRTPLPHRGRVAEWLTRLRLAGASPLFDWNLMLERVRPEFHRAATRNVLIPNPEYFRAQDRAALASIDAIWVKTRHAARLFAPFGKPVHVIGFTSPDRRDPSVPRTPTFFHGPGRSANKGTAALIALWARHPEWPQLTVAWRRKRVDVGTVPANVRLIREHLDDAAYQRLQNEHRFHLCPSQTEGFGHYLAEAMSCGAVVVTLDAEPMNELVDPDRGVLVPAHAVGTQDLATLYGFDAVDMERAITRCVAMRADEAETLGAAARTWYAAECSAFPARLRVAMVAV